jgi:integrase/recombinase XerD
MRTTQRSLRDALKEYLDLRRALGFKLKSAGRLLGQFVDYLEERGINTLTTDDALTWASLPSGASAHWRSIRLSAVRGFAAYLHGIDASVAVPPAGLLRCGPCRATPYLYSGAEVASLLEAATDLRPPLRAATYYTLIGLLAVSGMRIGEAIALDDQDLDIERGVLVVRESKFDRSRLVPLHSTTTEALLRYKVLRDELCPQRPSTALLVSSVGTRLLHSNIGLTFARLTQRCEIARRSASCRPRVHDFRHAFAVASLLDCYSNGDDVAAMLPRLATYLGHTDPKHTFWYLSAAPELMALAGQRLDAHLEGRA